MKAAPPNPSPDDCATVWFARLEHAKNNSDFQAAAEAVRELKRLGVTVKFEPRPEEREALANA